MNELAGWENFYVIVGSSAGALIGLQFVVMTLIAQFPTAKDTDLEAANNAFGTPTIVHLGAVLLLAAVSSMPWHTIRAAATAWVVLGAIGTVYAFIVTWRMRTQRAYSPELEDWLFHAVLPLAAYATLLASGCAAYSHSRGALFIVGSVLLLLLFTGIHNAWDAVTYHVVLGRVRTHRGARQE
jgi:nucleoside recognition membrane protein YjiH